MEPGTRLDHYEIVDKLGEGGMGEVWRARDTKLARDVALKVLPAQVAADAERIARFERESRLLAALNHSGIAAIYGMQRAGDSQALVLELVEGQTLGERIAVGPVPVDEGLSIALQLAEAMEYAHERGIVHRDLKPANVKIDESPDGDPIVKVLDFGLAVALAPEEADSGASSSLDDSPTMSLAATRAGVILGTAAYMSPEQAKGKPVDRRADIWAFGVILTEMLTGQRLFAGDTPSEIMAAVIMKEVDLDELPADTPQPIRLLLQRCLRKEPRQRLRDIGDARIVLQEVIAGEGDSAVATGTVAPRSWNAMLPAVAALALVIGAAAAWMLRPGPAPVPHRTFALPMLHTETGSPRGGALSPDATRVAYTDSGDLWLHDLDRLRPRLLVEDADAVEPFWSPDSRWVFYGAGLQLMRVSSEGGEPEALGSMPQEWSIAAGGAVMPDGRVLFTTGGSGLLEIPAGGGDARVVLEAGEGEVDFHDVAALPGGRGVLLAVHKEGGGRRIAAFDGAARVDLVDGGDDPVYSPTGHLVFGRAGGVWAVEMSLSPLSVLGTPFRAVADAGDPSVAGDGTLLYQDSDDERLQWTWYEPGGRRSGSIGEAFAAGAAGVRSVTLSPDGRQVAYALAEAEDEFDVWVAETASGESTRLTFERGSEFPVSWSPDGEEISYGHDPPGREAGSEVPAVMRLLAVDGSGTRSLGPGFEPVFTPDGERVIYVSPERAIRVLRLDEPKASPETLVEAMDDSFVFGLELSPDGRALAYTRFVRGVGIALELVPFPEGGSPIVALGAENSGRVAVTHHWLPTGDGIVFVGRFGLGLHRIDVSTGDELLVGPPRRLMIDLPRQFDVAPDGRYLAAAPATQSGLGYGLVVVQNWFAPFAAGQ